MDTASKIDNFDRKMLQILAKEGRATVTTIAKRIGLSKTPCQMRLKRLEKTGVITGYQAMLDPVKLGLDHITFVEVKLDDTRDLALQAFNIAVLTYPEIEQCHMIAGNFDYLLKIRSSNMTEYRRILSEVVSELPHVASTSTHVCMEAVKDRAFGSLSSG